MKHPCWNALVAVISFVLAVSCSYEHSVIQADGLSISPENLVLKVGEKSALTVTLTPVGAQQRDFIFTSSRETVATVSSDGVVEAISVGEADVRVITDDGYHWADCHVTVLDRVTGITLNRTSLTMKEGEKFTLVPTITPEDETNKAVTWSSSDGTVATVSAEGVVTALRAGTATVTATTLYQNRTADCSIVVHGVMSAVDLGLSVKWASCNLGASSPEKPGGFYQWAGKQDVSSKDIYLDWDYCPYHTGSLYTTGWTKYTMYDTADYNVDIDPEDDVASITLGEKWRIPTDAEWTKLIENCSWTWTDNYNGTGVAGKIVTSNISGYTDKSIFLPAAGSRYYNNLVNSGATGEYWSSSLDTEYHSNACGVFFIVSLVKKNYNCRYYGLSVRPVSD